MTRPTYHDIEQLIAALQTDIDEAFATASTHEAQEVIAICDRLLQLITMLNQKDAPR